MLIRLAKKTDSKELLDIYKPFIKNTAISFEYDIPTIKEFEKRIEKTLINYPYLVCIIDDKIVGYAYASRFKERKAYDYIVELSIYINPSYHKKGIGKALYNELFKILIKQNVRIVEACIARPDNLYVSDCSIKFHEALGFKEVGRFEKSGYKFNKWFDVSFYELIINDSKVKEFIPFSNLTI